MRVRGRTQPRVHVTALSRRGHTLEFPGKVCVIDIGVPEDSFPDVVDRVTYAPFPDSTAEDRVRITLSPVTLTLLMSLNSKFTATVKASSGGMATSSNSLSYVMVSVLPETTVFQHTGDVVPLRDGYNIGLRRMTCPPNSGPLVLLC